MSQYQKLAIVLFRVLGIALVLIDSVITVLHILVYRAFGTNAVELVAAILYLILGVLLTVLSKPLSRLVVKGFKEE